MNALFGVVLARDVTAISAVTTATRSVSLTAAIAVVRRNTHTLIATSVEDVVRGVHSLMSSYLIVAAIIK